MAEDHEPRVRFAARELAFLRYARFGELPTGSCPTTSGNPRAGRGR
ncbi:hypothetical protein ACNTMW_25715 [Planosporangium sp. 12N6]